MSSIRGAATCYNSQLLNYIKCNSKIAKSTNFQGTLYERTVMRELATKLRVTKLVNSGGAFDQGIDISGKWDLQPIYDHVNSIWGLNKSLPARYKVNGRILKPLKHSLASGGHLQPLDVIVQCKAFKTRKITARDLREVTGIFTQHAGHLKKAIVMLCSPTLMTKDAIAAINQLPVPITYLQIDMIRFSRKTGELDLNESGQLLNYYENEYASKLLDDCGIQQWLAMSCWELPTDANAIGPVVAEAKF
ncbi:HDL511Cp [Eremothecium sinecaudum]|uniref:Required for respiratory growth protein 7, mitochondrial n=1 Tax=Eremothecium sinecaudum TaxID=45286 RepID=A0A109UYQ8_9SACH|nr:HDL511Cp [Eremothecium sinecaudum]AMD20233.1 HDL511Cp [Eremothecium sinecaudum]